METSKTWEDNDKKNKKKIGNKILWRFWSSIDNFIIENYWKSSHSKWENPFSHLWDHQLTNYPHVHYNYLSSCLVQHLTTSELQLWTRQKAKKEKRKTTTRCWWWRRIRGKCDSCLNFFFSSLVDSSPSFFSLLFILRISSLTAATHSHWTALNKCLILFRIRNKSAQFPNCTTYWAEKV